MGFSRQEYWSGLPFPSPGDLPDPGIKPRSPALQADALSSELPRKQMIRNGVQFPKERGQTNTPRLGREALHLQPLFLGQWFRVLEPSEWLQGSKPDVFKMRFLGCSPIPMTETPQEGRFKPRPGLSPGSASPLSRLLPHHPGLSLPQTEGHQPTCGSDVKRGEWGGGGRAGSWGRRHGGVSTCLEPGDKHTDCASQSSAEQGAHTGDALGAPVKATTVAQGSLSASLLAQMGECLPAMWETWVQSLGQEDPLEEEMATHSSILAWKVPWTEEPGGLQSMGLQRVRCD